MGTTKRYSREYQQRELERAFASDTLSVLAQGLRGLIENSQDPSVILHSGGHKVQRLQRVLGEAGMRQISAKRPGWDEDSIPIEQRPQDAFTTAVNKTQAVELPDGTIVAANDVMVYSNRQPLFKPSIRTIRERKKHFTQVLGGQEEKKFVVRSAIAAHRTGEIQSGVVGESHHYVRLKPLSKGQQEEYVASLENREYLYTNGGIVWENPVINKNILAINGVAPLDKMAFSREKASMLRSLLGTPDCIFGVLHALLSTSSEKGGEASSLIPDLLANWSYFLQMRDGQGAHITSATAADLSQVAQMYQKDFLAAWQSHDLDHSNPLLLERFIEANSLHGIGENTQHPDGIAHLVVREEGTNDIIGFASMRKDSSDGVVADVRRFHISRSHANKGVGRALLRLCEVIGKQQGCQQLRVSAVPTARTFFAHQGFEPGSSPEPLFSGTNETAPVTYLTATV